MNSVFMSWSIQSVLQEEWVGLSRGLHNLTQDECLGLFRGLSNSCLKTGLFVCLFVGLLGIHVSQFTASFSTEP